MDFTIEIKGPADQIFKTKIVGVTFDNADGRNRQEILINCKRFEEVVLEREYENEHDIYAIKVLTKSRHQLGYVPSDKRLAHDMDMGIKTTATIFNITGGKSLVDKLFGREGKAFGCIIEIRKGGFDEETVKTTDLYRNISNKIREKIRKASDLEKDEITNAIKLYKEAIVEIIDLDSQGYLARAYRFERIPINRLTLLLDKNNEREEALEYLNWYLSYTDYMGLGKTDKEAIDNRYERLRKKK